METNARWNVSDIPDLSGRAVIVTGANSGIGAVTAAALSASGASVTMAVRDLEKGREAAGSMTGTVEVMKLDLSDLASVREFAASWSLAHPEWLDLLINNAGILAIPRQVSVDGFEMQLATNHLGHFALTGLLLPALVARPQSRVVTVASSAHKMARSVNFDDLMGESKYRSWGAYGQSKLANLLFTAELQRRLTAHGMHIKAMAAHPGFASTNLQARSPQLRGARLEERITALATSVIAQSAEMGALPTLYAATAPGLPGDTYVGPDGRGEVKGFPKIVGRSSAAKDEASARRLWNVSEKLTGVEYPFD
jgi:NAD(P)-dependent dehydrogenase (short-subunit alcohol dehydrogenase family)